MAPKKQKDAQLPSPAEGELIHVGQGNLMDRVVSILEQARANVARTVNSNMVIAYWLIGREIVETLQRGEDRAGLWRKPDGRSGKATDASLRTGILHQESAAYSPVLSSI